MSSESVRQAAGTWVDFDSFHTRLVIMFKALTASVRNILDTPSQACVTIQTINQAPPVTLLRVAQYDIITLKIDAVDFY
jgi:hypothetical protein